MYYCQDANMYEKVTSVISWNCPIAAPSLWNKLPENIRSAETFATFKKLLKTFLFKKYLC